MQSKIPPVHVFPVDKRNLSVDLLPQDAVTFALHTGRMRT